MNEAWTIRRITKWMTDDFRARDIGTARLDAELLVGHALSIDRVALYMDLDRPLKEAELTAIRELVARRRKKEPVAYILGSREFYGRDFETTPAVLIPRPDTETLIERALQVVSADDEGRLLDLCTGSGCIGITLAAERPRLRVDLTDVSSEALAVARRNAERNEIVDGIAFYEGDLFAALPERVEYRLIVANPPYIAVDDASAIEPDVAAHEPHLALFAGGDGLDIVRRIVKDAASWLADDGVLLMEIGAGQSEAVIDLLKHANAYKDLALYKDLAGIDRVVEAIKA